MKNVFMYATHPTLVDHESLVFMKRGFNVYTAAWATNTRSDRSNNEIYFNDRHPYKGKCDFLSDDDISVLSHIDVVSHLEGTNCRGVIVHSDVRKVLLDKFDILYVSQITPWLMGYARNFLESGKSVIFRTLGYPLHVWGTDCDYQSLFKYKKFFVVPTDAFEVKTLNIPNQFIGNVYPIMAALDESLIDCESKLESDEKFLLVVNRGTGLVGSKIKEEIDKIIRIEVVDKVASGNYIDDKTLNKLFNSCYIFLDVTSDLLRYSMFEAILHRKPVLVYSKGYPRKYMKHNGMSSSVEYWFEGFADFLPDWEKYVFYRDNPDVVNKLYLDERRWLDNMITINNKRWDILIERLK